MNFAWFRAMLRLTLTNPRQAGAHVIDMGFPMQGLWVALMLVSVLLSLLVSAVFHFTPVPPGEMGQLIEMSPAYHTPLLFALLNWAQALISVFVLHWVGRSFGGQGELADILAVMIWLQVVSLVLAVVLFLLGLILPLVGGLLMIAAFFWGLWATIALIAAANRFDSLLKAAGVCVATVVVFTIGMTILSALLGGLGMTGR
ncbi:MAG: YIP1 family protein [Roseovarius sp.]